METRNLFSRKIICLKCQKPFKAKIQHKERIYVDSSYDNYSLCERKQIKQQFLLDLLDIKFRSNLSLEEKVDEVEKIEANGKYDFTIYYKNYPPTKIRNNYQEY